MATFYQTQRDESYSVDAYTNDLKKEGVKLYTQIKSLLRSHTLFHTSFFVVLSLECTLFFLSLNSPSFTPVLLLASFILTLFSYIILLFSFQGKKLEQMQELDLHLIQSCYRLAHPSLPEEEKHLAIAKTVFELAASLGQKQTYVLSLFPFSFVRFASIRFLLHFRDILSMQEILVKRALAEYLLVLKLEPTDLAIHTSLANVHMTTATFYQPDLLTPLAQKLFRSLSLEESYQTTLRKAIEELKILDDLAPNDPWTHAQLASCYHSLEAWDQELFEYELLSNLRSKDKEVLYRLGLLYFKLGKTAKGLRAYESLKGIDAQVADHLLSHYFH